MQPKPPVVGKSGCNSNSMCSPSSGRVDKPRHVQRKLNRPNKEYVIIGYENK